MSASCARRFSGSSASSACQAAVACVGVVHLLGEQDAELHVDRRLARGVVARRHLALAAPRPARSTPSRARTASRARPAPRCCRRRRPAPSATARSRRDGFFSFSEASLATSMRRPCARRRPSSLSISRWLTAISFSQSRRFSYICLRNAERLGVVRIELEDRLVRLDRLGLVRELLQEQVRDAQVQLDLLVGRLDDRRLLAQQRDQIRPALHRLVLRGQRVGGLEVVGLDA